MLSAHTLEKINVAVITMADYASSSKSHRQNSLQKLHPGCHAPAAATSQEEKAMTRMSARPLRSPIG